MHSGDIGTRAPDPRELLSAIAQRHRRPTSAANLHDPNVCTSTFDWRESFEPVDPPSDRFRHCVRITYRKRPLALRANDRFLALELASAFNIAAPFSINRPDRVAGLGIRKTFRDWSVFVADGGSLPLMLEDVEVVRAVEALQLDPDESLHVHRNKLIVYARPASVGRVDVIVEGMVAVAERLPKAERVVASFEDLPAEFSALLPRFRDWTISDDSDRHERLTRASRAELATLVEAVTPFFGAINQYLDRVGVDPPESALALGALAECAAEAQLILRGTR
jgi:hypothetical protein